MPFLLERERQQVLTTFNDTERPRPHESFASRSRTTGRRPPNLTTIVCAGESLSYEALNRRANQLARYLSGCGIGPGASSVCMCLVLDLVVALIVVHKSGAAPCRSIPISRSSDWVATHRRWRTRSDVSRSRPGSPGGWGRGQASTSRPSDREVDALPDSDVVIGVPLISPP